MGLEKIDHFVVLMLENRSFDNLLGAPGGLGEGVDGLSGNETNPDQANQPVPVWGRADKDRDSWIPDPDPGELFTDIKQQINVGGTPPMSGFVQNYVQQKGDARDIMHYFLPDQVQALTTLAKSYAVCDRWFAAAPCQTWPNRFFVHTGTAGGYQNNMPLHFPYTMPTIFRALEGKAPLGWEIYYHDFPQALTLSDLWDRLDHFRNFEDFLDDAAKGHLPSYSFIEPRYFADTEWPNDMHPPHHITYGNNLIAQVYNALLASPNWNATMLIIIFDEHGGCYDHVTPPAAVEPEHPQAGQAFNFDRYGVRVPAVIVSPWIKPGTVLRPDPAGAPFDHTSVIRTLRARFGIGAPLTARDAVAPHLGAVLNLAAPTNAGRLPVQADPLPAEDDAAALEQAKQAPLNNMQQGLHAASTHLLPLLHGVSVPDLIDSLGNGFKPVAKTGAVVQDAVTDIRNVLGKLFS